MTKPGKSAPEKCQIIGMVPQAVSELMNMIDPLKSHIFCSNWHRNIFEIIRRNLLQGYIVQIFDFEMNFHNMIQDEVQSAYWNSTQTAIHATLNYFLCPVSECSEVVTLALVHITDDLQHNSFVARAAHDHCFKYLVNLGLPLDTCKILQLSDNCSSQYKSRRPFMELAHSPLNIIQT